MTLVSSTRYKSQQTQQTPGKEFRQGLERGVPGSPGSASPNTSQLQDLQCEQPGLVPQQPQELMGELSKK